jgi:hypothetical protein
MPRPTDLTTQWARLGAQHQLQQLDAERREILAAFPHLRGAALGRTKSRRRGPLSAAARKKMSAGMRRYWAKRKAREAGKK